MAGLLPGDLAAGSRYDLWLTIGKAGTPARIEWELLIAESVATPTPETSSPLPC